MGRTVVGQTVVYPWDGRHCSVFRVVLLCPHRYFENIPSASQTLGLNGFAPLYKFLKGIQYCTGIKYVLGEIVSGKF